MNHKRIEAQDANIGQFSGSPPGRCATLAAILRRYASDLVPKFIRRAVSRHRALASQRRVEKRLKKYRDEGKTIVHFLHIGKTAGTAVRHALKDAVCDLPYHIELRGHGFLLRDLPLGDKAVIFLRDPVSRFVSAFNSTRTEGLPRYYYPLGPWERVAFKRFPTANSLARALSSPDVKLRRQATSAMNSIRHVNTSYWDWLHSPEYLEMRSSDILFVGFQESLDVDFETLKKLLGVGDDIALPQDSRSAYRAPVNDRYKHLDDVAMQNIKSWYASDYRCISLLGGQSKLERSVK